MTQRFRFGPVSVDVPGGSPVAGHLQRELADARVPVGDDRADVTFQVQNTASSNSDVVASQAGKRFPYRFETQLHEDGVSFALGAKLGAELYHLGLDGTDVLARGPTTATVAVPSPGPLVRSLLRPLLALGTRDFVTFDEVVAKNAMYELLDPLVWCALLARGATFVHSGAVVSPDGEGMLLMGTGGVGKTTTVLDLVLRARWSYLGDDLAILSADGISRYPKNLQVYAYNADLVPEVEERLLADRSALDRFAWHLRRRLLGPAAVRRRMSASSLFGADAVVESAPLAAAVKLTAAPGAESVVVRAAEPAHVARQAASVICDEFWDFVRFINSVATLSPSAPTVGEVQVLVTEVLERNLANHPCYEVLVPPRTPGAVVSDVLRSRVL